MLLVLTDLAVYKNLKTTVVQTWSVGLAWQHQSCPPWAGYGVTRSFSWALRFACTRPLWCPFFIAICGRNLDTTLVLEAFHMKCQRQILHIHWSQHVTNTEISAHTGLPPVMDFIWRRHLSVFGHLFGSLRGLQSSTQCPTLSSWPSIRSFTWQGLETSS